MEKYGHDESVPTPAECKLGVFVGECGYLTEYLPHYFNLLAALLADR